ncbi:MAG TPA: TIGR03936 family radical SAM-associated protein, partial [Candidatus Obscuribacterales bacterium]
YNEFSLLSLSCSDYLALPAVGVEVKNRLKNDNISLSLPSQRVDRFDENIAHIIGGTRQTGLTFAPEAGTQRMRDIINKGLTNEELLRGVKTAYEQGWDRVKLYFMIGLPGETDADVLGIAETVRWLQQECRQAGRKPLKVNLTISNFTPKPHTPFQWHSVSTSEFLRKQALLAAEFKTLRGIKANFTDVRISAMEDFVGRGDRRLAAVVRRAWELGAGMDSWWESLERAFQAWTQAIDEAGLSWQYRQVETGEWNVMASQTGEHTPNLDAPLPWDHLDTGIDKQWLKEDLHRALAAATVPDCSFEGCSHCGVCGPDFGHNIVVPPPPIPAFEGHFQPDQNRAQRVRVWLGKLHELALLGHLDLVRLFDRAVRRAAIPIAFTGGFHPGPRISPANALPLGATSSGEIVDFELTTPMDLAEFRAKLAAQLPADMPIYAVADVPLTHPSATKSLEQAEYLLVFDAETGDEDGAIALPHWETWLSALLATPEVPWQHTTKSGKKKQVNLRDRLFHLALTPAPAAPQLPAALTGNLGATRAIIRYIGSCRNDGTLLRPEHVTYMLEQVAQRPLRLLHTHRLQLILSEPTAAASADLALVP